MEWIKKHWTMIVIGLLVLLFFSMCSSNCSNKNKIRTLQKTYASSDSVIAALNDSIKGYQVKVKELSRDIKELESEKKLLEKNNSDLNVALRRNVVVNIKSEKEDETK